MCPEVVQQKSISEVVFEILEEAMTEEKMENCIKSDNIRGRACVA